MRVAVVGTGYVGLVAGAGLAEHGHRVVCVDRDRTRVAALAAGRAPVHEPGLDTLVAHHLRTGLLRASSDLDAAVRDSDLVLVCVGTPSLADGSIDLSHVEDVATDVGAALRDTPGSPSVVVKSTVAPGCTEAVVVPALEKASGRVAGEDFGVGVNPEFLSQGTAVRDFLAPDRIVLGGDDIARAALRALYAGFDGVPVVETNVRTAEMVKYASNAVLAAAVSFSNEIANLGAAIGGIDTAEVMRGVRLSQYLNGSGIAAFYAAGCGFGGSCLPKDVDALVARGSEVGQAMPLLRAVTAVNDDQPLRVVDLLERELGDLAGRTVAVLGLAFKPGTDDVRCSPAGVVLRALGRAGARVVAHDPVVGADGLATLLDRDAGTGGAVAYTADLADAVRGADAVAIVTSWPLYLALPALLDGLDRPPLVVDGRRMLDPASVARYAGIGL